jgi:hypothetical protein
VDGETYDVCSGYGLIFYNHHPVGRRADGTRPTAGIVSRRILPGADKPNPEHLFVLDEAGYIRYPIPVILVAICAALPWLPNPLWRFSLRTLLIATTLVAVVLGLVVAFR